MNALGLIGRRRPQLPSFLSVFSVNSSLRKLSTPSCSCANSVKPYDIHIGICTNLMPDLWPSDISEADDVRLLQSSLQEVLKHLETAQKKIKFNYCAAPAELQMDDFGEDNLFSLMVFPGNKIYSFPRNAENATTFFKYILSSEPKTPLSLKEIKVPWKRLMLVCCHGNRDMRCGRIGPQVVEALRTAVVEDKLTEEVRVLECSHLGGHRFAGTAVTYPSGNYFGFLSRQNAKETLLKSVVGEEIDESTFRGNAFTETNSPSATDVS
jgi:hypothetical protein